MPCFGVKSKGLNLPGAMGGMPLRASMFPLRSNWMKKVSTSSSL